MLFTEEEATGDMLARLARCGRWGVARRASMLMTATACLVWVLAPVTHATSTSLALVSLADGPMAFVVPTVHGLKPSGGSAAGGTHVTVVGSGFQGATEVHFGAASASFTVSGTGHIKASAPAGTGTVDVTVTTPAGTSAVSPSDQFSYVPVEPIVVSVSPSSGPEKGAKKITLKGTGFAGATEVHFGPAIVRHLAVKDKGTEIGVADPPFADVGKPTVDVTVTTPLGTSTVTPADEFSYRVSPPSVSTITPREGTAAGGETVQIVGTGFVEVMAVRFGSVDASEFTVNSLGSITAIDPAETVGLVQLTVTTPFGTSHPGLCPIYPEPGEEELVPCPPYDTFKYVEPTITNMSPNAGPAAGGTTVTITGTGFGLGATKTAFDFKKTPAVSVDCLSITMCEVVAPPHSAGAVTVTAVVHAPHIAKDRTSATPADRFTYE